MKRLAVAAVLGTLAVALAVDMIETALRALRSDPSLKVRTQAALVLGQRRATEAVPALADAVERDDSAAVRIAAASALAKIRDPGAREALERVQKQDPDPAVRSAAGRALEALAPPPAPVVAPPAGATAFSIEEPGGAAGSAGDRRALREAIERHLTDRGFAVVAEGGLTLKPSVVALDVREQGGRTIISVKAGLLAVERSGRMAAMLESGARVSVAAGRVPDAKLATYSARAFDAVARDLCDDLASRLADR
jgi:hypothetical protein